MIRKSLVAAMLAGLCTLGAAGAASAETAPAVPPAPQWIPVFYFGTQLYCNQAGAMGELNGALPPGMWMCDSGWLMVQTPPQTPPMG
jgi:hypothetical protein